MISSISPRLNIPAAILSYVGGGRGQAQGLGHEKLWEAVRGIQIPDTMEEEAAEQDKGLPCEMIPKVEEKGRQLFSISTKDQPGGNGLES